METPDDRSSPRVPAAPTEKVAVERRGNASRAGEFDVVAVEEPLEVRVLGKPLAVVMRTPGDDPDLAVGFVVTEGMVAFDDISAVGPCVDAQGEAVVNVINIALVHGARFRPELYQRATVAGAACGICGKTTLDQVAVESPPVTTECEISQSLLLELPARARKQQKVFDITGGIHASVLFDLHGECLMVREDVGRHNGVDKIVGALVRKQQFPPGACALFVSGRAGFEIIQKARVARIPIVAAVGAPSSLAIRCADEGGITLAGFLRDGGFNIYTHGRRVTRG